MNAASIYHVTFLRHGESVGNAENRFQGQSDFPLTDLGMTQAHTLADRWVKNGRAYDLCISSPLVRARQTAEIIVEALNLPLEISPDWMEVHNGKLAGLRNDEPEYETSQLSFMTPYSHLGAIGESRLELLLRAGKVVQNLIDRGPARYLVVAHGGILNMALHIVMDMPLHANGQGPRYIIGNTGFVDLTYEPERHLWRFLTLDNSGDRCMND